MTRPADWAPLAAEDPVPGDPTVIRAHARHLAEMADDIAAQVTRLQRIAAADGLVGEFVEPLKQGASQLAERLGRVQGRYREVAAALGAYAPELEAAQEESLRIRRWAQVAEADRATYQRRLEALPREYLGGSWQPMVDGSGESAQCREPLERERDQASAEVAQARAQLRRVEEARDRAAAAAARRIEQGVDDSVVDSWWDSVKEWVHHQAGWMKGLATALGYIGVALFLAGLVWPAAALLAPLAVTFSAAALALHGVLAAAGEGSWADVALDVFGLATLKAGTFAATGVKAAQQVVRALGATKGGTAAAKLVQASASVQRTPLLRIIAAAGPRAGRAAQVLEELDARAWASASEAALTTRLSHLRAPLGRVGASDVLRLGAGDPDLARLVKDAQRVALDYPADPMIRHALAEVLHRAAPARVLFGLSAASGGFGSFMDATDSAWSAWRRLGDAWTIEIGSTW